MRKILIAECKQEVSTFNPVPSRYEDFAISFGDDLLQYHRSRRSEVGGALNVFASQGDLQIVPAYGARFITSGGTLAGADFRRISSEFLSSIKAAPPVDGVYFCLHGAMAAEGENDPEGYLLAETRKILGERIPLVISLDLHGIPTERMFQLSDAVVMYHTYPHVDFYETGERAARLLLRIMNGEARPVTARVSIPALVRGDELITETGVFGQCIRAAQAIEQSPGGLCAGMFIGNPFTDVPELCSYSVVTTDGDPARAEREAIKIANSFWQHREKMQAKLLPLKEGLERALKTNGTVVLVDAADATSSGASGDSNVILRELIKIGGGKKALIPIVDPAAVKDCWNAGVGGVVETTVGGAMDGGRFKPLPIRGTVRMLSDGRFRSESFGDDWYAGNTAVVDVGPITLIITSRAVSLYDRSLFHAHGRNPRHFDLVVVKSPHTERHMFTEWCADLVNLDLAGSSSANLPTLGHVKCRRPIFPLDPNVAFNPQAALYQRNKPELATNKL